LIQVNIYIDISIDSCATMILTIKRDVQNIQKSTKNALFYPCHNLELNLSISKLSTL